MEILRKAGLLFVAVCMMACQKGGGDLPSQKSMLIGSWQAISFKDTKNNVETKVDENGFFVSPEAPGTYTQMFLMFDDTKLRTLVVIRDSSVSDETTYDYTVGNNILTTKSKNSDGSPKADFAQITSLSSDAFELKSILGVTSKFKRVTDAVVQDAKKMTIVSDSGPNKNGCVPLQGHPCTIKPNLILGQIFTLQTDIDLPESSENYYVSGKRVKKSDLLKRDGQDFCRIAVSLKHALPHELELPNEYQKNGIYRLPKAANPYTLKEISWYIDTVFFRGTTSKGEPVGFVVSCGSVQNDKLTDKDQTSLVAIQKHFTGLISLQQK